MADEIGATAAWTRFNLNLGAAMLREAASITTQITGTIIPSGQAGHDGDGAAAAGRRRAGHRAPGMLLSYWASRAIAMPLACGNTVVLKTSEICPRTHRLIGEVLRDAELGPGVVNIVSNAPADAARVVEALIAHPAVRRVNFTGSTRVGRLIAEVAGRHPKALPARIGRQSTLRGAG